MFSIKVLQDFSSLSKELTTKRDSFARRLEDEILNLNEDITINCYIYNLSTVFCHFYPRKNKISTRIANFSESIRILADIVDVGTAFLGKI